MTELCYGLGACAMIFIHMLCCNSQSDDLIDPIITSKLCDLFGGREERLVASTSYGN